MLYLLVNLTFFLVNEDFLNTALEVSTIYNDGFAKERLNELKELSDTEIEERARSYIESEYLKREFVFTYLDYLELLELDDLLLRETNYHYLLGNPYILHYTCSARLLNKIAKI